MQHQWLTRAVIRDVYGVDAVDARVSILAGAQEGALSREQAALLGMSAGQIRRRRERGLWVTVHENVYAVGHELPTVRGRAIAALLAGGPQCRLSLRAAAAIWEIRRDDLSQPDVTGGRELSTLRHHRSRGGTFIVHKGLRVTPPDETILDCAEVLPPGELAAMIREARVKGLVTPDSLERLLRRSPGRRGVRAVRGALSAPAAEPTKAWSERRLLELIARTDLPRPEVNVVVAGKERDMFWRDYGLIAELDAIATHGDAVTFGSDRARDNRAAIHDLETRRFTRSAVRDDPLRVLTTIAYRLGARSKGRAG